MLSEHGHPWLAATLDLLMRPLARFRPRVVPKAQGRVLEIGVGTGLNAPLYNADRVTSWVGVEPDPHMRRRATSRIEALPFPTDLRSDSAEQLPFPDGHFDSLVCTFTLCTIPNAPKACQEMFRVLKPKGLLIFAEHTVSDSSGMASIQRWLNPVWKRLSGGCHLDRDPVRLLQNAGFTVRRLQGSGRRPWNLTPIHYGRARLRKDVLDSFEPQATLLDAEFQRDS